MSSKREGEEPTGFAGSSLEKGGDELGIWCVECGRKIEGEPYTTGWNGWCACFEPIYFCSAECFARSKENSANWD